jgi:hypothetical protein
MAKQGLCLNGGSRTELSQQDRLAYDQGRTKVAQDNCHQQFGQVVKIQVVTAWAHCFLSCSAHALRYEGVPKSAGSLDCEHT